MARQEQLLPFAREVVDVPVSDEMSESFLAYSLSVITARAIPDVRDGLKPVQRRILYSMLDMGLRPANPHRKCARVVAIIATRAGLTWTSDMDADLEGDVELRDLGPNSEALFEQLGLTKVDTELTNTLPQRVLAGMYHEFPSGNMEILRSQSEPWRVTLIDTGQETMTGGRIGRVLPLLQGEEAFHLTYGDGVGNVDITALTAFHKAHAGNWAVPARRNPQAVSASKTQQKSR